MSLPRIVTIDPRGVISQTVQLLSSVMDYPIVHVDTPDASLAYEEVARDCDLLITAYNLSRDLKGFEVAMRVKQDFPEVQVIVVGDSGDPEEFDEETRAESPYVYLSRPFDVAQFLRVLEAGINGQDIKAALSASGITAVAPDAIDMGPVPTLDVDTARPLIESLLIDLGAMAVFLATRTGEILIESGAVGYLNREQLMNNFTPAIVSSVSVKDIVGGQINTLLFFDGDDLDVFLLSVGLHHYLLIAFDGTTGSRQIGGVNRYGRKTVEDLIAQIGASAFFIQRAAPKPVETPRRSRTQTVEEEPEEIITLEKAHLTDEEPVAPAQPALELDPIEASEDELAALFGDSDLDLDADDLFDLEDVEALVKENQQNQKGILDRKKAEELGLF